MHRLQIFHIHGDLFFGYELQSLIIMSDDQAFGQLRFPFGNRSIAQLDKTILDRAFDGGQILALVFGFIDPFCPDILGPGGEGCQPPLTQTSSYQVSRASHGNPWAQALSFF